MARADHLGGDDPQERFIQAVLHGEMNRREFLMRATAAGLTFSAAATILAACGSGGDDTASSASPKPMDTTLPESLALYNWVEYISPEALKGFEEKYGIKVEQSYYDSNEAMMAKLQAGAQGWDVVVPDGMTVSIMSKMGLIQPLDMDYIPNFKNVMPSLQAPAYDPGTDGKKYCIPYQWGTTGIGHRKDILKSAVTTWEPMFDEANKGDIVMLNDIRDTLGAGLKSLGYSLNTLNQDELDAGTQKMIDQKPLVEAYDSANTKRLVISGTPLVHGWTGYILSAYKELGAEKLEYVLPTEGFAMFCDNMAIPANASSPYAAHLFLDYVLDPQVAGSIVDYTWYSSPVPAAEQYSKEPLVWDFVPDDETLARGEWIQDVGEFRRSYEEAWRKLKSA
jgi:spermidine/putrescine transport system substrate-binding protein